ncbi:oligoendopeptidase F [Estrella lausannensis]|uniref:Oligopeptidase F n=1 Tax=Estrella lausannensis TaxID=483423 RepID=A0A0H5DRU4_9BACT|nr:oligoendopeptidase F [Estrella lausannensis]CRX38444.1 Oligoendopeptidase F [Estrella lausannensis]
MILKREETSPADLWNVEALYSSIEEWNREFDEVAGNKKHPPFKELSALSGTLGNSAEALHQFLIDYFSVDRKLRKLYTYAHLRHDEDVAHEEHKKIESMAKDLYHAFSEATSFFEAEILSIPEERFQQLKNSPLLTDYRFFLEKLYRMRAHTLSPKEEKLLAIAEKPMELSHRAFSSLTNADFHFGKVEDSKGELHELTHGSYHLYIRSQDRTLRMNAFKAMHGHFGKFNNTLSELIKGAVQKHEFTAKTRNFPSCLDAALYPHNIDTSVYYSLIEAVNNRLPDLHRYIALREKILNVGPLHLYDMYVPLVKSVNISFNYEEAEDLVIDSVKPLGASYQDRLLKGLKNDRWVDRFENKNKRSGAYSSGCYDSQPYILMNYKESIRDLFTLAHEAGHSMHSYLANSHQKYHDAPYPIFLAEVASTFNEELLAHSLLKKLSSKEQKIFLLNEKIEDIRATLFRQTMFAEFELMIHEKAEKGIPLTPGLLNYEYMELNKKYFGERVIFDDEAKYEWSRIPHFYANFYVYQYATGISAALTLAERVMEGGRKEQEEYLGFLQSGSSKYPLDTLFLAGVDMRTSAPIEKAIDHFTHLVDEMEALITQENAPREREVSTKN